MAFRAMRGEAAFCQEKNATVGRACCTNLFSCHRERFDYAQRKLREGARSAYNEVLRYGVFAPFWRKNVAQNDLGWSGVVCGTGSGKDGMGQAEIDPAVTQRMKMSGARHFRC